MKDEIVDEIHQIRRRIWEECDCDREKFRQYLLGLQDKYPGQYVTEVPRTESEPSTAKRD